MGVGSPIRRGVRSPFTDISASQTSSTLYALAPPPTGADDSAMLQALINAHNPLGVEVVLRRGVYRVVAEIACAAGAPLRLSGLGTVYTPLTAVILTQAARSVVAITEKEGYCRGITFDANRLGNYVTFVQNGADHRFIDCRFMNALLDGAHCSNTGLNQGLASIYSSFDTNGKTYATAGVISQYPNNTVRQPVIAGTAGVVAGSEFVTITGGPDITTFGVRVGDMIRVVNGASSFFGQIASVAHVGAGNDVVTLQPAADNRPTFTASGLDFVIGIGWGWYEEQQGGNGYNMLGGNGTSFFRSNGCGGVLDGGLYGNHVKDSVCDGNNFSGRAMGFLFNAGSVFEPTSEGVYMENNLGPDYVLGSTRNAKIDTPGGGSPIFSIGYIECEGVIIRGGAVESMQFGVEQNFLVEVRDNAGTIQHRIVSEAVVGNSAAQAAKIVGNSLNWVNTPTVNNVTDFVNGVGLYDAGGVLQILLNVAQTQSVNVAPGVSIEVNSTGVTYYARSTIAAAINVNGTTIARPAIWISDNTGAVPSITTTTIPAGKSIGIRVKGPIR